MYLSFIARWQGTNINNSVLEKLKNRSKKKENIILVKSSKMGPKKVQNVNKTSNSKAESTNKPKVENSSLFSSREIGETSSSEEALDSSKYSSRKLNSNWQKYDNVIDLASEETKGLLDFSNFSGQKPSTSSDSYFRFSNEKNWEVLDKFDDYFKLNVNDLCREIMCVPLHERLKLSCVLTPEQIEIFTDDAKMYQCKLKEPLAPTKDISGKMLSLLSNESDTREKISCKTGWSQPGVEELADKQNKTWDSNSENFFSLSGVEEELDLILALPLPTNEIESRLHLFKMHNYIFR